MRQQLRDAVAHLRDADRVLAEVIDRVGPCELRPRRDRFAMLVYSIIGQQVSVQAARTIRGRLIDRVGTLEPHVLRELSTDEYRNVGVSGQKARYIRDLAEHVVSGDLRLNQIGRYSDQRIIDQLIVVKGVGRWTAQMFLIFALNRLDILPHGDLGIVNSIRALYRLPEKPTVAQMDQIAEPWRPYASVASWYCWRSLDLPDEPVAPPSA